MSNCQTGFSLGFDGGDSEVRDSVELDDDSIYRMWENFGQGINWRIWRIVNHSPIFYSPVISVLEIQESTGI